MYISRRQLPWLTFQCLRCCADIPKNCLRKQCRSMQITWSSWQKIHIYIYTIYIYIHDLTVWVEMMGISRDPQRSHNDPPISISFPETPLVDLCPRQVATAWIASSHNSNLRHLIKIEREDVRGIRFFSLF